MQIPTCYTQSLAVIVCALMVVTPFPASAETPSEKADAFLARLIKTNDPGLADREHDVPITP